jgi:hypothetical protein
MDVGGNDAAKRFDFSNAQGQARALLDSPVGEPRA